MDITKLRKGMKEYEAEALFLWTKCPKCHDIVYIKEVQKLNKCPKEECGYVYPYPFAKVQELKRFLRTGATSDQFSKLVSKMADSIKIQEEKEMFLSVSHQIVPDYVAWLRAMKKYEDYHRREFEKLDKNKDFQRYLKSTEAIQGGD